MFNMTVHSQGDNQKRISRIKYFLLTKTTLKYRQTVQSYPNLKNVVLRHATSENSSYKKVANQNTCR